MENDQAIDREERDRRMKEVGFPYCYTGDDGKPVHCVACIERWEKHLKPKK